MAPYMVSQLSNRQCAAQMQHSRCSRPRASYKQLAVPPWVPCSHSSSSMQHSRCRVAPQDTQPAARNTDWSANLLQLTKKNRKKSSSQQADAADPDVFDGFSSNQQGDGPSTSGRMLEDDEFFNAGWGDGSNGPRIMIDGKRLPAAVRCFDTARIYVKSGDGGAGCVAFRREPYVEKGGPNGGNGGRGGHVWAIADQGLNSLLSFRNQAHFRASNGSAGQGSFRDGADGGDLYIKVPVGTIIRKKNAEVGAQSWTATALQQRVYFVVWLTSQPATHTIGMAQCSNGYQGILCLVTCSLVCHKLQHILHGQCTISGSGCSSQNPCRGLLPISDTAASTHVCLFLLWVLYATAVQAPGVAVNNAL
eukprot:GHRR01029979.1.p1 GENE.GHRR01029979.1~~GHRR01029979.1.p1  ORF type:complete len:363 (-),score=76.02 GHRR01029979.1:234-1322(-)